MPLGRAFVIDTLGREHRDVVPILITAVNDALVRRFVMWA